MQISRDEKIQMLYESYTKQPTKARMAKLLEAIEPILAQAEKSYGVSGPVVHARAKVLAANAVVSYQPGGSASLETHIYNQLRPLSRYARQTQQVLAVPERVSYDLHTLKTAETELSVKLGRQPSDLELADRLNMSPSRIQRLRQYSQPMPSEVMSFGQVAENDAQELWSEFVYHELDPIDQAIFDGKIRSMPPIPANELARKLNISPSAVSQRSLKISQRLAEGEQLGWAEASRVDSALAPPAPPSKPVLEPWKA